MTTRRPQGNSLLTVMILLSLIVALTFAMLVVSRNGTIIAGKTIARDQAKNMADATIAMAVSKLKEGNLNFQEDLEYVVEEGAIYGTLTFNDALGEPYSLNNLVSSTKRLGWNDTSVPPKFCHLVAVGHHHGYTVVRHALVKDPPFPYSLASAGKIEGTQMEVFGIESMEALADGAITDDEKQEGHVVSNSSDQAGNAITLGSGTTVSGNVKAAGLIDVSGAVVQGDVLPNSAQQNLPDVDFNALDPQGKPYTYDWNNSLDEVVGRARHQGDLTIGDLELAEGLLFVDGDITVTGNIKGKGAIVATGKITVTGSMDTTSDLAALVAQGDITIDGDGPNSSRFQGMVYSEGSIDIRQTTIMGAAVSKDVDGTTTLEDVTAVNVPELTSMNLEMHVTLEEAKTSNRGASNSETLGIRQADGSFTRLSPDGDTESLKLLGSSFGANDPDGNTWDFISIKDGVETVVEPPFTGISVDTKVAWNKWDSYISEHQSGSVQIVPIVDIDLNTLISIDQDLEMMFHTTANKKGPN